MTTRGRIVIPSNIRKRYGLKPGIKVHFIDRGNEILLLPVTKAYIRSVRGILKSKTSMTRKLLKERALDRDREREEGKI